MLITSRFSAPGATTNAPGLSRSSPANPSGSASPCHGSMHTKRAPGLVHTPSRGVRSEEHTSELQSLIRISYAVFCLKKKKTRPIVHIEERHQQHQAQANTHKNDTYT